MGGRGVALRAAGGWLDKEIEMEESTQKKNIHPLQGTTKEQKKNTHHFEQQTPFTLLHGSTSGNDRQTQTLETISRKKR
jgi:hypothetical protein